MLGITMQKQAFFGMNSKKRCCLSMSVFQARHLLFTWGLFTELLDRN